MSRPEEIQRAHYAEIAEQYDSLHMDPEHIVALSWLDGILGMLEARSCLDVGSGTGRAISFLKDRRPGLRYMGIEPVAELREVACKKGIGPEIILDGSGYDLPFDDEQFDVVCEVGVLHHVADPNRIVAEMLRVAKMAIFISDSNNFGGGQTLVRFVKQMLHKLHLWKVANLIKTGGKGYSITEGDGLFYSYSVFDSLRLIRSCCPKTHILNTVSSNPDLYRSASHVALLGIKERN